MNTDNLQIQIKTFFGLEPILAEEIKKLGGKNVEIKNRAVNCEGDLGFLYKINYSARTALKIIIPLMTFKAWDEDRFYDKLVKFEWDELMDINQTFAIDHITEDSVRECLQKFVGEIQQIPPNYSACKVNGRRAYDLARNAEVFELKPKILVIDSINLISYDLPSISISIVCSKGTYIRALARDIGECLLSGAHLTSLIRTRVGDATLSNCLHIDELDDFFDRNI